MEKLQKNFVKNPEHVPDKKWKEWTLTNLPSSENYWVTDIDSFIRSRYGCFLIVEIKRQQAEVKTWQSLGLGVIAQALNESEGKTIEPNEVNRLPFSIVINRFCGIQEIVFENTWFHDGKVYLNGKESSEHEIKYHLKFGAFCTECFPESCDDCCESNHDIAA